MTSSITGQAARRAAYKARTRSQQARARAAVKGRGRLGEAQTERGNRRRERLIKAATEEFLDKGYEGASLREILRLAGGSSDTLYKLFGDKGGLFIACATHLCSQFMVTYTLGASERTPQQELTAFGIAFMRNLLSPESIGIYRMMVAEVKRFPELGKTVLRLGHDRVAHALSDYLETQTARRVFSIKNCDLAAQQFIDMIHGGFHWRPLLLTGPAPTQRELAECVETAAMVFCRGYAAT